MIKGLFRISFVLFLSEYFLCLFLLFNYGCCFFTLGAGSPSWFEHVRPGPGPRFFFSLAHPKCVGVEGSSPRPDWGRKWVN